MSTLILGFPLDIHIHAMRWALAQLGQRSEVVYSSDLPQVLRSSLRLGPGMPPTASFRAPFTKGATDEFDTVWFRRSGVTMQPPAMPGGDWTIAQRECEHQLRSLRHLLAPDALWVNPIEARERALLKPLQLEAAQRSGFTIPDTLISNDPDEIRRFHAAMAPDGVVFKLAYQANWHAPADGRRHALFTSQVSALDLQHDDALAHCPAIYQRRVAKAYELRVTCIDEVCYAARLDSQARRETRLDWRAHFSQPLPPRPHTLPVGIESRCIALMRRLGLTFGCIDLIVTPGEETVFLEVNEMGQFLWVEAREPRFPLLRAFATLLTEGRLTRSSRLAGRQALAFHAFVASGAWDRGRAEDAARHAHYEAPGLAIEEVA